MTSGRRLATLTTALTAAAALLWGGSAAASDTSQDEVLRGCARDVLAENAVDAETTNKTLMLLEDAQAQGLTQESEETLKQEVKQLFVAAGQGDKLAAVLTGFDACVNGR
ncbi:hypothetical protein KIK06_13275 [Nocardiopsis sp. EMB25]|uniref:hypothetical protein n=1 Tax=Nocardiopsis sp. EMB25 TaxID=2835867 RepID=UPI0022845A6B|nr:hypothetical protein [Nocardiopsis sp. EMB25]MCY9784862.1 hypothetical protein [Nocardiopsis sp. EMB25]